MRTIMAISNAPTKSSMESLSPAPAATSQQRSPWHSPVPYLFGGLAAMLGLIAFALLILACSYWRLSGQVDNNREGGDDQRDLESGDGEKEGEPSKAPHKVFEEKILVIMAGHQNPTCLATPVSVCSKPASFGDRHVDEDKHQTEGDHKEENPEKVKEEVSQLSTHDDDEAVAAQNRDTDHTQERRLEEEEAQHQNQ